MIIDGLDYGYLDRGRGPTVVLLHGFTGSAQSWEGLTERLVAAGWRVIAPDLPGHGATRGSQDPERFRIERVAADVIALCSALDSGPIALLGYSMGGRLALYTALAYPQQVRALILESASPGLADADERAARRAADEALAERIERDGIEAFVDHWENLPLFASLKRLRAETRSRLRAERLRRDPGGLAASLRGMGTGAQPALWSHLSELTIPMLIIAGAEDAKYADIARHMGAAIATAEVAIIPEAGHVVHLEQPDPFYAVIGRFLASLSDAPTPSGTSP